MASSTFRCCQVTHLRLRSRNAPPALRTRSAISKRGRLILRRSLRWVLLLPRRQGERVQGASGGAEMTFGKMQVQGGFFQIVMAQQQLNGAQVGTSFEQVGCETMAQRVRMNLLRCQTGPLCRVMTGVPDCFGSDGSIRGVAASTREQPLGGLVLQPAPVLAQSF